jgi:hypothetical protein
MKSPLIFLPALLLSTALQAHEATSEMAHAAQHFLGALSAEQKAKAQLAFADANRHDWHFVPRERRGLSIKEMTQEQRLLAQALLATGLSHRGHAKAATIMSLEALLASLERGSGPVRDPELFYVTIFGEPGEKMPWGWRFEGHHLSLNFTSAGKHKPSMTPSFFGSNPGEVREGRRAGTRPLAAEEELGRALIKALDEEQRKVAIILPEAPRDIFNMPGRSDTKPEGISHEKLSPEQREMLMRLIKEYLFRCRPDVAAEDLAKLEKAGLDKLHFGWAGGLERGEPHYYRVQGGTFVLEYDNTQNGANHVHSVWRDFDHDFGQDMLKAHYDEAHAGKTAAPASAP